MTSFLPFCQIRFLVPVIKKLNLSTEIQQLLFLVVGTQMSCLLARKEGWQYKIVIALEQICSFYDLFDILLVNTILTSIIKVLQRKT